MGFQKVKYNAGANIVEIKIRDESGKYIENWVLMMPDLPQWFSIMSMKYGFTFKKSSRDLDWAI